jgi:hypothetical protein
MLLAAFHVRTLMQAHTRGYVKAAEHVARAIGRQGMRVAVLAADLLAHSPHPSCTRFRLSPQHSVERSCYYPFMLSSSSTTDMAPANRRNRQNCGSGLMLSLPQTAADHPFSAVSPTKLKSVQYPRRRSACIPCVQKLQRNSAVWPQQPQQAATLHSLAKSEAKLQLVVW